MILDVPLSWAAGGRVGGGKDSATMIQVEGSKGQGVGRCIFDAV